MYYKDFLLKIFNEGISSHQKLTLIPHLNKKDSLYISFMIDFKELKSNGQLIKNLEIKIDENFKSCIEYCVLDLKGFVYDIAKDNEKLWFPTSLIFPIPIGEFDKILDMGDISIHHDFTLHVVHSNPTDIPFDCISLYGQICQLNDPKILDKIPMQWSYCLEPTWNTLRMKFEKKDNEIIFSDGSGWISWESWIEACKKKFNNADGTSEEEEEDVSMFFKGYMPKEELNEDLKTIDFLSISPKSIAENMHTYFQWKSLKKNIQLLGLNTLQTT